MRSSELLPVRLDASGKLVWLGEIALKGDAMNADSGEIRVRGSFQARSFGF